MIEANKFTDEVIGIIRDLQKHKHEVYIVGGAVRDILLGKEVHDWDFTTDAKPKEIQTIFPKSFYSNKFGTVSIPSNNEGTHPHEITTYRTEQGYKDYRRPTKVLWGTTLEEDLKRRDFTINAMAIAVSSKANEAPMQFQLRDIHGGQKDLKSKKIRAVGDPNERFSEDALRLLRAIRIAAELKFKIEEKTMDAIKTNASLINKIAAERIRDEFIKIISSPHPDYGIYLLREADLLKEILPELEKTFGVEQKSPGRHHIYDVGTHLVNSLKEVSKKTQDPIVRIATLLHDIGKPQTFKKLESGTITFYNHETVGARMIKHISQRLRFSKKQSDKLWKLVRYHQFTVDENQTDTSIRRFIRKVTPEYVEDMLDLRVGDRLGGGATETSWRLEEFKKRLVEVQKQPFSINDLKVDGNDVMKELKIKPGPTVGQILKNIFKMVIDKKVPNEKAALLKTIKEFVSP